MRYVSLHMPEPELPLSSRVNLSCSLQSSSIVKHRENLFMVLVAGVTASGLLEIVHKIDIKTVQ